MTSRIERAIRSKGDLLSSMLAGSTSTFGLGVDYAVILVITIVLVKIGVSLYLRFAV